MARPSDWTGTLAEVTIFVVGALMLLPIALVRIPPRWVALAMGESLLVRLVMLTAGLWLLNWARALLLARLPLAPYLVWNTLVFADRGERRRVKVPQVQEVYVELQAGLSQVLMVELSNGTHHELCPIDWPGAGRLYRALSRKLRRRQRRDLRKAP